MPVTDAARMTHAMMTTHPVVQQNARDNAARKLRMRRLFLGDCGGDSGGGASLAVGAAARFLAMVQEVPTTPKCTDAQGTHARTHARTRRNLCDACNFL